MIENETPLESWKEIAAYLQRNVVTVRRWEQTEGLMAVVFNEDKSPYERVYGVMTLADGKYRELYRSPKVMWALAANSLGAQTARHCSNGKIAANGSSTTIMQVPVAGRPTSANYMAHSWRQPDQYVPRIPPRRTNWPLRITRADGNFGFSRT